MLLKVPKKKKKKSLQIHDADVAVAPSPLLEAVLFPFIEQICFWASQIHNLRTAVSLRKRKWDEICLPPTWNQWEVTCAAWHLHLSPGWCTLCSSRHQTLLVLHRWRSGPDRSHSCTRHKFAPECTASHRSHRWRISHHLGGRGIKRKKICWLSEKAEMYLLIIKLHKRGTLLFKITPLFGVEVTYGFLYF